MKTREVLDTALRNVAARLGLPYCLYLNNKNSYGYFDDEINAFILDDNGMIKIFAEEVKLLQIELHELQYDKHQQDKIDYGEEYDPTAEEVS